MNMGAEPMNADELRAAKDRLFQLTNPAMHGPGLANKTVKIPVVFRKEVVGLEYDTQSLRFKEGTAGYLIVDEQDVLDPFLRHLLQEKHRFEILPTNARVVMQMLDKGEITQKLLEGAYRGDEVLNMMAERYVKVDLREPLRLLVRGTKRPALRQCKCHVPALDKSAVSLNEAYSLLSRAYEPNRRSDVGNVFASTLFFDVQEEHWSLLDSLRENCTARYEEYVQDQLARRTQDPGLEKPQTFEHWLRERSELSLFSGSDQSP